MPDASLKQSKRRQSKNESRQINYDSKSTDCLVNNVKCSCVEHHSKEMLNEVYNVSVNFLWECIFGPTKFCYEYWKSRKFYDFTIGDWELGTDCLVARTLEFYVDLGVLGQPKNFERQKIIEYSPNNCIVIMSDSQTNGVMYADYFTAQNKFCFSRVSENKTRLLITSQLNFVKKPNFLAKGIIDRNAMGALRDSYIYLGAELPKLTQPRDFPKDISAMDSSNGVLDKTISSIASEKGSQSGEGSENEAVPDINGAYKRITINRLNSESKSIGSSYSEYLDLIQDKEVVSSEVSYPSLYNAKDSLKKERLDLIEDNYEKISNCTVTNELGFNGPTQTIQKFNFLWYQINVDTLVRVFIVAMLCLMFINGVLYCKLLRIENIAHNVLKNCQNLANKKSL